jgi:hypothetical protein
MSDQLATALERLADSVGQNRTIIGEQSIAFGGPGNKGNVVGSISAAHGGPGGSGTVIGKKISVGVSGPTHEDGLIKELRDAAAAVRQGNAPRSWVSALISRVGSLGNAALGAAVTAAASALASSALK